MTRYISEKVLISELDELCELYGLHKSFIQSLIIKFEQTNLFLSSNMVNLTDREITVIASLLNKANAEKFIFLGNGMNDAFDTLFDKIKLIAEEIHQKEKNKR